MGSSLDGVAGSGSIVDWPFLSMILSAADPEPDSLSFSESFLKVKMVLPVQLINGLFVWDVSLQFSSRISGSPDSATCPWLSSWHPLPGVTSRAD